MANSSKYNFSYKTLIIALILLIAILATYTVVNRNTIIGSWERIEYYNPKQESIGYDSIYQVAGAPKEIEFIKDGTVIQNNKTSDKFSLFLNHLRLSDNQGNSVSISIKIQKNKIQMKCKAPEFTATYERKN